MDFRIIFFASFVVSAASSPSTTKQYRPDYEYNENTDAFYKLHTGGIGGPVAARKCTDEGAELMKVTSDDDGEQIQSYFKKFPDLKTIMVASNYRHYKSVVDGTTGAYEEHDSNSEKEYNVVMLVNREGKKGSLHVNNFPTLPFVCKVQASVARSYSDECSVYSQDYVSRISTTGSCYRVSADGATWEEANAICQAEGAHLVILNNEQELEVVNDLLKEQSHDSETQYFAGVKAERAEWAGQGVFRTVFNETLEEVGYGPWEQDEPNNDDLYVEGEDCVALDSRRHGKYNDVPCFIRQRYVCEGSGAAMEIRTAPNGGIVIPDVTTSRDYDYGARLPLRLLREDSVQEGSGSEESTQGPLDDHFVPTTEKMINGGPIQRQYNCVIVFLIFCVCCILS